MASFKNLTGAKLIVTDEFGLPVTIEAGATKSGLSNYFERYTSKYQTGENVLLQRIGDLDPNVILNAAPSAIIEEENMAVRPSQGWKPTLGLRWGDPGKNPSNIVAGYGDVDNNGVQEVPNDALRLRRIGFDTSLDTIARQVDTRYLGMMKASIIASPDVESFAPGALNGGGGADRQFTLTEKYPEYNGKIATEADVANPIFGKLLTLNKGYTAWGTFVYHDDSENKDFIGGFVVSGLTVSVTDDTCGGALTELTGTFVGNSTGTLTWTRSGGQAADTISTIIYYNRGVVNGTTANAYYDTGDNIRRFYEINANTGTAGILILTETGILEILHSTAISFTAWS